MMIAAPDVDKRLGGRMKIIEDAPLARLTTFKVGGRARRLVRVESIDQVRALMSRESVDHILAGASNVVISDAGLDGVTLLISPRLDEIEIFREGDAVLARVGAGSRATKVASYLMKRALSGFEFGYGLPGSIGGAARMNAGAFGSSMSDIVKEARLVLPGGELLDLRGEDFEYRYRGSTIPTGGVLADLTLRLRPDRPEVIFDRMRSIYRARARAQPLDLPSAGSIFKNPRGDHAGRLIDSVKLKGARVGGASISERHANFIVNDASARAEDIYKLIWIARRRVKEEHGIELELEVKLMGEFRS